MTPDELLDALRHQRRKVEHFAGYYAGGQASVYMPNGAREEYREMVAQAESNWCELVVDVVAERLIVDGFRSGEQPMADSELWAWWQANKLDARQAAVHTDALVAGTSYVSVWPAEENGDAPTIRPESPLAVYAVTDPDDPFTVVAAIKVGARYVWHYTAAEIRRYRRPQDHDGDRLVGHTAPPQPSTGTKKLELDESNDELGEAVTTNPLDAVPFVPFVTSPNSLGYGRSDLAVAIPIQDRITSTTFDRLMAQKYSAFRQRWATGMAIPVDETTGEPVQPFAAAVDRLWMSEDPDTNFGEFEEATLTNYVKAVDEDIRTLASVTRTPPHYLLGQMVNLSAEALKAAEVGLTSKVQDRQQSYGESWEEVMRLAAVAGDRPELAEAGLETVWRRTETVSEAQAVDAAVKLSTIGVPRPALWERIGATPQQIELWTRMTRQQRLVDAAGQPVQVRQPASAELAGTPLAPPSVAEAAGVETNGSTVPAG